ncbi:hypothetical protein [Saccharothrix lopnurensis]|uniref:Uncharacterized protein n=1 Tax=Saccharothrix lopnurensis TaxID=1670621 RepID=A0ABW1P765_9PSEU
MTKRTMTHELAKDARNAGGAIYAAADRLPVMRLMMVSRSGVELTVQDSEDGPPAFRGLLPVVRCAAEFGVPVLVELDGVGPWGTGGLRAWCNVVLPGQHVVSVETLSFAVNGHAARWLVEDVLGRDLEEVEFEVPAAELLAAIESAGGAR